MQMSIDWRLGNIKTLVLPTCASITADVQLAQLCDTPPAAVIESKAHRHPRSASSVTIGYLFESGVQSQSAANDSWYKSGDLALAMGGRSVESPMLCKISTCRGQLGDDIYELQSSAAGAGSGRQRNELVAKE